MARAMAAAAAAALMLAAACPAAAIERSWQEIAAYIPDEAFDANTLVMARVDLSDQTMHLYVRGQLIHVWPVSSGLGVDWTPTGRWNAYWLSPNHRSSLYNNAPMPWAVFFNGNYAVHGTNHVDQLGQPASHGCIRLAPDNAELFFKLVQALGMDRSVVAVVD